jgi:meiotically up-regulated gene 157 (Mug157) protein
VKGLILRATKLSQDIMLGILTHGIMEHKGKRIFTSEVNGFGGVQIMDDANIPILLGLPYIGFKTKDEPALYEI